MSWLGLAGEGDTLSEAKITGWGLLIPLNFDNLHVQTGVGLVVLCFLLARILTPYLSFWLWPPPCFPVHTTALFLC